jgi:hypothetical protein
MLAPKTVKPRTMSPVIMGPSWVRSKAAGMERMMAATENTDINQPPDLTGFR